MEMSIVATPKAAAKSSKKSKKALPPAKTTIVGDNDKIFLVDEFHKRQRVSSNVSETLLLSVNGSAEDEKKLTNVMS